MVPSSNNCVNIGLLFTRKLGVRLTKQSFKAELSSHQDFPSILSLSESLSYFNISNIVIGISINQLREIPLPGVGHFIKRGKGQFVIFERLENKSLIYIDETGQYHTCEFDDLKDIWNGVVLLAEVTPKSGEEGYKEKRQAELFQQISTTMVWILYLIGALLPIYFLSFKLLPVYFLKVLGAFLALLLVKKQFGNSNATVDAFCKMGNKSDCDSVINAPASKLFGIIHLSEIGLLYFTGGLLTIAFSAFSSPQYGLLFFLSIFCVPFSFFALYYQAFTIKKWCPLCLAVLGVLWLEVAAHLLSGTTLATNPANLIAAFLGFSLPVVFWLSVRQQFLDSLRIPKMEQRLNRFIRSENTFQLLLEKQTRINFKPSQNDIQAGRRDANVNIVVVSNPHCNPCARAHVAVERLMEKFEDKLDVIFRFLINPNDTKSESYQMLSHLFAIRSENSNDIALKSLSDWYRSDGKKNFQKWQETYPASNQAGNSIQKQILDQSLWAKDEGINATPTIFINGKRLPEEFSIEDLDYQIRKLLEKVDEGVCAI